MLSISFSPDSKMVGTASKDKTAILWSSETGEIIRILNKHDNYV